jgi:hypothetical protein
MLRKALGAAVVVALGIATVPASGSDSGAAMSADDVALEHVRSAFGLDAADVDELEITDSYVSSHTGVQHVYLRQQHRGLDVLDAVANVNVSDGEVLHAGSRLVADLDTVATGSAVLDAPGAYAAAAEALGLAAPVDVRLLTTPSGVEQATTLSEGGVAARPVNAHLAYQTVPLGTGARLVWVLDIELPSQQNWYLASVDAETGELISSTDLVVSEKAEDTAAATTRAPGRAPAPPAPAQNRPGVKPFAAAGTEDGSSYNVFALPLESPNDGPRSVVTEPADPAFSPFGWHDLDGKLGADSTTTLGNNVHAYADTGDLGVSYAPVSPPEYDNDAPDPDPAAQPDGGTGLDFDFPFTPDDPTALQNRAAAVTNLFYWNNTIHDVLASYGFDEASGNFQTVNYTGEGVGNDSVKAQAQDGGGPNNANFATPAEGQRPRMQMFLWDPSVTVLIGGTGAAGDAKAQLIDGDFDAGVIAHEYGHGVSNRLTGGPANVTCLRTSEVQEQMGEGWSDFFGVALTMRDGDDGATPRGLGNYVIYKDSRSGKGIRPFPYSTDLAVNPATYNFVRGARAPHGVGFVWNTMLYDMYWALVDKHGFNRDLDADWSTGGNNLAVQLVMDGMKFQPCKPGFEDGRDAILKADVALTGGANKCEIWGAFARRGLGVDATQGSSASKTDGFEGFALPADCT